MLQRVFALIGVVVVAKKAYELYQEHKALQAENQITGKGTH